ncbi:hypothetical protein [Streptoalloteichus tenebrarius]|nr:hypothetical protein [Streptoalloteichus tenebrarius]
MIARTRRPEAAEAEGAGHEVPPSLTRRMTGVTRHGVAAASVLAHFPS